MSILDLRMRDSENFISLSTIFYPIGSVFMSKDSISPAELFGGTWHYKDNVHLFQKWYIYERIA